MQPRSSQAKSRARLSSSVNVNVNSRDSRAHRGARHQVLRELRAALHRGGAAAGHLQGLASASARASGRARSHTPYSHAYADSHTLQVTRSVLVCRRCNIATLEHITQTQTHSIHLQMQLFGISYIESGTAVLVNVPQALTLTWRIASRRRGTGTGTRTRASATLDGRGDRETQNTSESVRRNARRGGDEVAQLQEEA